MFQPFFFTNLVSDIMSKLKTPDRHQEELDSDSDSYFRYASSSIYLNDSLDSSVDESIYESTKGSSLFEKSYVSFPVLDAASATTTIPNNTLFTMPEVITATATPLFYNTPHSKPIWSA